MFDIEQQINYWHIPDWKLYSATNQTEQIKWQQSSLSTRHILKFACWEFHVIIPESYFSPVSSSYQ